MKKWIILDRDGTIIVEKNYLHDPCEVELLPGAAEGLNMLSRMGYLFAVATNQSGIGRGYYTQKNMDAVHTRIAELLGARGVHIEGWFHCPHLPDARCGCRKPGLGLVRLAEAQLGFGDKDIAFVMGDKECDIRLADAAGASSVLLLTGYGLQEYNSGLRGTLNCGSICEAAERIGKMTAKNRNGIFTRNLAEHAETVDRMDRLESEVCAAAERIIASLRSGGRLFLCGNGGSAADAQHIAAELSGRYLKERPALDAMALSCNTSALTAIGNDYGYGEIFARQLEAHGRPGDVLIAISTSGGSENILAAVRKAKELGIFSIGLTGKSGEKLREDADMTICVPSECTPRIQEMHILIGHSICEMVEEE